jgi:hypothetical protein
MANPTGKGGFQKGNPGGPGRPRRAVEQAYLDVTVASVPVGRWKKVVKKALEQAEEGDGTARAWLSKHLIGDDPIPLMELVEELRVELERLKSAQGAQEPRGNPLNGNGTPATVRGPAAATR